MSNIITSVFDVVFEFPKWMEGLEEDMDPNVSMERKQGERLLGVNGGGRVFTFRMGADDDRQSSIWTSPHTS